MPEDLRYAVRALWQRPATTLVAIVTLALGIGINTAVFSVFESILLNPLPYRQPDRLVSLARVDDRGDHGVSAWLAHQWLSTVPSLTSIGLYTDGQLVLTGDGDAEVFRGQRVSAGFFDTLGVSAMLGRLFTQDEARQGANVVVLSHELWTARFGADPAVVGRTYTLNGSSYRIVGVLPRDFQPFRMTNVAEVPRIFAPFAYKPGEPRECRGTCESLQAVGRLADGASIERARTELAAAMQQISADHPDTVGPRSAARADFLQQRMTAAVRPALWVALGAAACVLVMACANLANVQLARAHARTGEFALRGALGASPARLARQVILESLIVAAAGGAAGVILGRLGVNALLALAPRELPRVGEIALDGTVLWTSLGASLVTALAAGAAPAWSAMRANVNDLLKSHGDTRGGRSGPRTVLVVAQVALAFVLVSATGLLVRTVHGLLAVEAGFDGAHVLTMTPVMGASGMSGAAALAEKQRVVDAVEALAGVVAAGMTNEVPLSTPRPFAYAIEGQANPTRAQADLFWVEGRYFDALRIALREGRLFTRHDTAAAPAAIVSESLARRFSEARAVGRRISVDGGPWLTVVGVVKDVRNVALDAPADEAIYLPLSLNPTHYVRLVARAAGDPLLLERPVRAAVRQIDPLVPIFHVQPMDDYVAASLARRRFALALMSCFGGLALLVACLGLYSVLGYTVSLRMPELGIRAALGATAWGLLGLILRSGVTLIGSGVLGGVLIAGVAMRSLESLLFGVRAFDLPTFVGAAATIAVAGIAASIVPARRAGRADPLSVIRS